MDHFSPSAACAEFAADLSYDSIPPEALDLIRRDILDWTGCALAGSRDRAAVPIQKTAELLGGKAEASVFGNRDKTDLRTAAMENGYFGHIFEMDDVDRESISHPATVVMPGAMALGEWQKKTGREVLTAIVAGFEVMLRIGTAITPAHYAIWHTTSTAGVFGAAAASGRMLGLTNQQMQWALGNAGTLACGLWQFNPDGAMSKFLHAGNAAGNGILVSLMAQNGFSGATHILEGKQGFFAGYARQSVNFDLFRDFGRVWRSASVSFKPYPCCRHTHSAIDAALSIREQLTRHPGDPIRHLTVHTYGTALSIAGKTAPATGRDAKFSISYCVASTILRGTPVEASFAADAVSDPAVSGLLSCTDVIDDPSLDAMVPKNWPCRIEAELGSGEILTAQVKAPKGDPENRVSWEECEMKFRTMTLDILDDAQVKAIVDLAKHFDDIPDFSRENPFLIANRNL